MEKLVISISQEHMTSSQNEVCEHCVSSLFCYEGVCTCVYTDVCQLFYFPLSSISSSSNIRCICNS